MICLNHTPRRLARLLLLTSLALAATGAGAATVAPSVSLVPSAVDVVVTGAFTVDLLLNAKDTPDPSGRYQGDIIIDFDPSLLNYTGFATQGTTGLRSAPVVATGSGKKTVTISFENAQDDIVFGRFSFTAIAIPNNLDHIAKIGFADADPFFGSFLSQVPANQPLVPQPTFSQTCGKDTAFVGTCVAISAVPLPAGVWFLSTGLAWLGIRRRFSRA